MYWQFVLWGGLLYLCYYYFFVRNPYVIEDDFKKWVSNKDSHDFIDEKDWKKAWKLYCDFLKIKTSGISRQEYKKYCNDLQTYKMTQQQIYAMSIGDIPKIGSEEWRKGSLQMEEYKLIKSEIEKRFNKIAKEN